MLITAKVKVNGEEVTGKTFVDVSSEPRVPLWPISLIPILMVLFYILAVLVR